MFGSSCSYICIWCWCFWSFSPSLFCRSLLMLYCAEQTNMIIFTMLALLYRLHMWLILSNHHFSIVGRSDFTTMTPNPPNGARILAAKMITTRSLASRYERGRPPGSPPAPAPRLPSRLRPSLLPDGPSRALSFLPLAQISCPRAEGGLALHFPVRRHSR